MTKFGPYIFCRLCTTVTGHQALCWLSSLKYLVDRLGRLALRLQEYRFIITYEFGKHHTDADCLCRQPLPVVHAQDIDGSVIEYPVVVF